MRIRMGALLVLVLLAAMGQPGRARPQGKRMIADLFPTQGVQVRPKGEVNVFQPSDSRAGRSPSDVTFQFPVSPTDILGKPVLSVEGPGSDDVQFRFPNPSFPIDGSLPNVDIRGKPSVLSIGSPGSDDVQFAFPDPNIPANGPFPPGQNLGVSLSSQSNPTAGQAPFPDPNISANDPFPPGQNLGVSLSSQSNPLASQTPFPEPNIPANDPFPLGQNFDVSLSSQSNPLSSQTPFPEPNIPANDPFPRGQNLGVSLSSQSNPTADQAPFPDPVFGTSTSNQNTAQFGKTGSTPSLDYPSISSTDLGADFSNIPDFSTPDITSDIGLSMRTLGNGNRKHTNNNNNPVDQLLSLLTAGLSSNQHSSVTRIQNDDPLKKIFNFLTLGVFDNNSSPNPLEHLLSKLIPNPHSTQNKNDSPLKKLFHFLTLGIFATNPSPNPLGGLLSKLIPNPHSTGNSHLLSSGNSDKVDLSTFGLDKGSLGSLLQLFSTGLDDIARESSAGLRLVGDEIQFMSREKIQQLIQNLEQAKRTFADIGQNTYRSILQKNDAIGRLLMGTSDNLGNFANSAVGNKFAKISEAVTSISTFINGLKTGLVNALIAKGESFRQLFTSSLETSENAFRDFTSAAQGAAEDNIRALTGIKKFR